MFVATIGTNSAVAPDYAGTRRIERWTATAAAGDIGPATLQARYLQSIEEYDVQSFGGTPPLSCLVVGSTLLLYLPGTTTATTYRIELKSRY